MSSSFTTPVETLSNGQTLQIGFGGGTGNPVAIPDTATGIAISVDRTQGVFSLDSLPATDTLHFDAWVSVDGGVTWLNSLTDAWVDFTCSGGVAHDRHGNVIHVSGIGLTAPQVLPAGTGRLTRGQITATGGTISFTATFTLTP